MSLLFSLPPMILQVSYCIHNDDNRLNYSNYRGGFMREMQMVCYLMLPHEDTWV